MVKPNKIRQLLTDYHPGDNLAPLLRSTKILLIVGPTGAGKDSLKDSLMETGDYHHIVSHTTRRPRINLGIPEKNRADYHFVSLAKFKQMLESKEFIEAKEYSGNFYGTSITEIKEARSQNKIAMTDMEVQGVDEYKKMAPSVMAVFLLPPDFKTWQDRLRRRYGDVVDAENYRLRLETALKELQILLSSDYYLPIVNHDIVQVQKDLESVLAGSGENDNIKNALKTARGLSLDIQAYLDRFSS